MEEDIEELYEKAIGRGQTPQRPQPTGPVRNEFAKEASATSARSERPVTSVIDLLEMEESPEVSQVNSRTKFATQVVASEIKDRRKMEEKRVKGELMSRTGVVCS